MRKVTAAVRFGNCFALRMVDSIFMLNSAPPWRRGRVAAGPSGSRKLGMAKVQSQVEQSAESHVKRAIHSHAAVYQWLQLLRRSLGRGLRFTRPWRVDRPRTAPHLALPTGLVLLACAWSAALGQSPALTSPAPGSVLPGSVATFTWTTVSDATSYKLELGSIPEDFGHLGTYTRAGTTATSLSVRASGLPTNGEIVYANLTWVVGGHASTAHYAYIAAFRGSSAAPVIGSLSCASKSFTGPGTDLCSVKLNVAAGSGGANVELASSESAAVVPDRVKVPAGSKSATFKAEIAGVSRALSTILMATDGKSFKTFPIELKADKSVLELNTSSIAFGDVNLHSSATQSLRLSSTGKNPLVIDSAKIAGKGFTMSDAKFPITLDPGKSLSLDIEFDPATTGAVVGALTIASNSVTGSATVVQLTGTGKNIAYAVNLTWDAPSAPDVSIAGYRVYRAIDGSSQYGLLNGSLDQDTSYVDETVQSGAEYDYYVETVDLAGVASAPSKTLSIAIP